MVHLSPCCCLTHNGLYDAIQYECLKIASLFFLLTVAFHLFLIMAYAETETSNKIMFSIIVAVLFAIRSEDMFNGLKNWTSGSV